jgi:predicted DNA-binding transcriptional regulator AlpA
MSSDASGSGTVTPTRVLARRVFISKWVNEKSPAWDQILTAHDVARLTRRQRWILSTLTILGKFPKKQRFQGRYAGWRRSDIEHWLSVHRSAGLAADSRARRSSDSIRFGSVRHCLSYRQHKIREMATRTPTCARRVSTRKTTPTP